LSCGAGSNLSSINLSFARNRFVRREGNA